MRPYEMVTAILREASCERGGRAAILVQYGSIFIEIALFQSNKSYSHHRNERETTNRDGEAGGCPLNM